MGNSKEANLQVTPSAAACETCSVRWRPVIALCLWKHRIGWRI